MPLRAAMPSTVTKPTSEPRESTPPPSQAANTPPMSANGNVNATRAVTRTDWKSACNSTRMPRMASEREAHQSLPGLLPCGVFAEKLRMITVRERQRANLGFDLARHAAEVATVDVAGHVNAAGGAFAFDLVRRGNDVEVGHVAEQHMPASREFR